MSEPIPARCRTTNWSEYNAALRRRGSLLVWLDREMEWLASPSGRPGRPQTFSDAAIQFCLSIKVLFGLALRQAIGLVESLLKMAGLDWPVPDTSTLCRRQSTVTIQIPYRRSDGNPNLLVDSTGVKMRGDGERQVRKHGPGRRRQGRKVHLAMDVATGDSRAGWRRSRRTKPSAPSRRTEPTTPGPAPRPSLSVAPQLFSRSGAMAVPGQRTVAPPKPGTRSCAFRSVSAGRSGNG
jgi:hypothetical protein